MFVRGRRYFRAKKFSLSIPEKANRILYIVLIGMLLILMRVWHLSVIQHEERAEKAQKPRYRVMIEPARRATIRDRFNLPLAINTIHYRAAVSYAQLKEIPSIIWKKNSDGTKKKLYRRKEYITQLAQLLGQELQMDAERIEDLIHSKAAFHPHLPYIIKEEISEKQYYRLKMLEKDWPGIYVQKAPKRFYPRGKTASDILGYMGAISRQEYDAILQEINRLETILAQQESDEETVLPEGLKSIEAVSHRLQDLRERAYTINDYVGKSGIEGKFEEQLRGFYGKKVYYSDAKGNFLREMPNSRPPLAGRRFLLTISAELQEFAEQLLAQNEKIRSSRSTAAPSTEEPAAAIQQPWIRGGAIVAMDPRNGEILALASYPRFDPNDFIPKGDPDKDQARFSQILRWFENESYIGQIWDQKRPLEREIYDPKREGFFEEAISLTWEQYLDFLLPRDHPVRKNLAKIGYLNQVVEVLNAFEGLLKLSGQENARALLNALYHKQNHVPFRYGISHAQREEIEKKLLQQPEKLFSFKKILDKQVGDIDLNYDKLFFLDLCRIAVCADRFSPDLLRQIGGQSLFTYREASGAFVTIEDVVQTIARELFHELYFKPWRKDNEKAYLKIIREQEKAQKAYAKPYIDHLDSAEKAFFQEFWDKSRWSLITVFIKGKSNTGALPDELLPYIPYFDTWHTELTLGAHATLPWAEKYHLLQKNLRGLNPQLSKQYLQTMRSFQELDRPLYGRYSHLRSSQKKQLEKHLAAAFYPLRGYGYGRSHAFRQTTTQGSIFKLVVAHETLKQRYNFLKQRGESLQNLNPLEIIDRAQRNGNHLIVAYHIDGTPIPQMYKGGRLAKTVLNDVGKIDIVKAIETSSNPYFSLLAAEVCKDPNDIAEAARSFSFGSRTGIDLPGEIGGRIPNDLSTNKTGLYSFAMGQHTFVVNPIQSALLLSGIANGGKILKPQIVRMTAGCEPQREASQHPSLPARAAVQVTPIEIQREVFMPPAIRNILLEGMKGVVRRIHDDGLRGLARLYSSQPKAIQDFSLLYGDMVGKSGSAESMEHLHYDLSKGTSKNTHIWFGTIFFNKEEKEVPHLSILRDKWGVPELVVIVYLRFGGYGKEAAPVAAQMIQKWKEIKAERGQ